MGRGAVPLASMELDAATLEPREAYRFLIGTVIPRPIAFVSTRGADGSLNLAPFSYFNAFASAPMVLGIGIGRKNGGQPKDTLRNILETGEFVVNLVTEDLAVRMNATSGEYPYGESEFDVARLTPEPSARVAPPRVRESPVAFECLLYQAIDIKESKVQGRQLTPNYGTLVLGEVVHMRVADHLLDEAGRVDPRKLAPIGRLGGPTYAKLGEIFALERPVVEGHKPSGG